MKNNIWFTSDCHFGHVNIHKFCPATRPDADAKVMNQKMIHQWQSQVQPDDDVFMLGDISFMREADTLNVLNQLPGRKQLVYGNHDKVIRNSPEIQAKFENIWEYKEIHIDGQMIVLFHYPIMEWNKLHHGSFHLHGHIHERVSGVPGRILNVCVDSSEMADPLQPYKLYSWEEVRRVVGAREVRMHGAKKDL